jgi:hypothetical protein
MTIQEYEQIYNMLATLSILIRKKEYDRAVEIATKGMDRISDLMVKENVTIIESPFFDAKYDFIQDIPLKVLEENLKRVGIDTDALVKRVRSIVRDELNT